MRALWMCLVLALPVLAQDAEELLAKAKALDAKAEVLLDQGRRAEAFELLAKAADLRAQARRASPPEARGPTGKQAEPKAKKAKKAAKQAKKRKAADPRQALDAAFSKLDQALERGDMEGARAAAHEMRRHLLRWTKQLDAREKRLRDGGSRSVEARIAALEKQVRELRRLMDQRPR
jgi:hypothetical protein